MSKGRFFDVEALELDVLYKIYDVYLDDYCSKRRTIAKHALLVHKGRLKNHPAQNIFSKAEQGKWQDERYESTSQ